MWETRRSAEQALSQSLRVYSDLLSEAFASVDVCVGRLERVETPLGRVCALVLIKARNFALACYSLSLDALAQEAGARFRPLIESLELLEYLRQEPQRVTEALEDRLPKARVIAQRIQGKFKHLRDYPNTHAAHLSVSPEAMGHLVDLTVGQLQTIQRYSEPVLRRNLGTLLAVVVMLSIEAANCVLVAEGRVEDALADSVDDLKRRAGELLEDRGKVSLWSVSVMTVQEEIDRSSVFGQKLEDLVVSKGSITLGEAGDRDKVLLAHWSLVLDLDKSILALMQNNFYGGAFALLRPLVEALVRAHLVLMGSDDDVTKIKEDTYSVNFKTIGREIDTAFNLQGFFDKFLNGALGALHSFAHSGLSQLGRRFKGSDLEAHYEDGEIIEVIHTSSTAVFMATNLVTDRFKFSDEKKKAGELFLEWGSGSVLY